MFYQVLPYFGKQLICLFEQGVLDTAESNVSGNKEHTIFTWKTLSPIEVKNHDLPPVGFSHNPLNGPKRYKVTHIVTK